MKRKLVTILTLCIILCASILGLFACVEQEPQHQHVFNQKIATEEFIATDATCTTKATYYYSCECGLKDSLTFEHGNILDHSFTNYVYNNDATCNENGTETAVCDNAGCVETHTRTKENSALDHDYGDWVSNGNDTHSKTCANDSRHVITEDCSGGTATETNRPICEHCGAEYGTTLNHEHIFNKEVTTEKFLISSATCTKRAVYHYSCTCGEKGTETFEYGDPLDHSWGDWDSNGNDTHTRVCLNDNIHTETKNCSGGTATCLNKAICKECSSEYGDLAEHKFTSYTSNGDGTMTAKCDYGCGNEDVEIDTSASLGELGEIEYNTSKTYVRVGEEINAQTFDAECYYSSGEQAKVTVTVNGSIIAGGTINVRLSVQDSLGNQKQKTIRDVKVYGMPTLTYDSTIDNVNISTQLNASHFSAIGTDSFGNNISVSVSVVGDTTVGSISTVILKTTDIAGNTTQIEVGGIKIYENPEVTYDSTIEYIKESDSLTATLLNAQAKDSFGNDCEIIISANTTIKAGKTINVIITATDEKGNQTTKTISGIKVYGMPRIEISDSLMEGDDISFIAFVYDSFGEELTPQITYTGNVSDGERVVITIKAIDKVGNSVEKQYTFIVNHVEHTYEDGYCTICDKEQPRYTREGDYIYFGRYPQTIKEESVAILGEANSDGYYLGSDGEFYAKVVADAYSSGYKFSTGTEIIDGSTYYFKVEPIRWRILSTDDVTAVIYCDSIIESRRYDDDSNNYKNSEIRAWLNEQFLNTAFTELEREIIKITTVDNSVYSTGYSSNPYACEDTEDKIFLLSYREATQISSQDRQIQTSDYARATYTWMSTSTSYYGNGYWWLRSPYSNYSGSVSYVNSDGYIDNFYYFYVYYTYYGVLPALQIQL